MATVATKIGPQDHGRRMTLEDFEFAEVEEGHLYELGRGVVVVSDIPQPQHNRLANAIRRMLFRYQDEHPEAIYDVYGGDGSKLVIPPLESERHPDLAVYRRPPPRERDPWRDWIPDLVIEVVTPGSSDTRDREEKPPEYHAIGVREYWIVDPGARTITVLRRWGQGWRQRVLTAADTYQPRLLPEFTLNVARVFAALDR